METRFTVVDNKVSIIPPIVPTKVLFYKGHIFLFQEPFSGYDYGMSGYFSADNNVIYFDVVSDDKPFLDIVDICKAVITEWKKYKERK